MKGNSTGKPPRVNSNDESLGKKVLRAAIASAGDWVGKVKRSRAGEKQKHRKKRRYIQKGYGDRGRGRLGGRRGRKGRRRARSRGRRGKGRGNDGGAPLRVNDRRKENTALIRRKLNIGMF